jgi:hypothetical protein
MPTKAAVRHLLTADKVRNKYWVLNFQCFALVYPGHDLLHAALGKQGIKWTKGFYGVELRNVQIVHRRLYIFMSQEIFKCDNIRSPSAAKVYASMHKNLLGNPSCLLACLTVAPRWE